MKIYQFMPCNSICTHFKAGQKIIHKSFFNMKITLPKVTLPTKWLLL